MDSPSPSSSPDIVQAIDALTRTMQYQALPTGTVVQIVEANFATYATGTTLIPVDNTIPQNTEGTQFMTIDITPKSATNKLSIDVTGYFAVTVAENITIALFQDTTANAIAVHGAYQATGTATVSIPLVHSMAANTTAQTTFKVRAGTNAAAILYFNGSGAQRYGGAITMSRIRITEYKA